MAYLVRFDGAVLRIDLSGQVSRFELNALVAEVGSLEQTLDRIPDRVIDLSGIEHAQTEFPLVLEIATQRASLRFPNAFRTAFIASTPIRFGFARMFQTLMDHPRVDVRIFEREEQAMAWLASGDGIGELPPG